jgi:hypothetical protein
MTLTTHPHLAPGLKKESSYTSTPHLGLHGLFYGELYLYSFCVRFKKVSNVLWGTGCAATFEVGRIIKIAESSLLLLETAASIGQGSSVWNVSFHKFFVLKNIPAE